MSIYLENIDKNIVDLEKEIKDKADYGLTLLNKINTQIEETPDYLFHDDENKYNEFMDMKDKHVTIITKISNGIDEKIKKLEKIKLIINDYIKINDKISAIINKQRIGSLLQHSLKETEKIMKENKIKTRKTIIPELIKNAKITIKNKRGGKRKSHKNYK